MAEKDPAASTELEDLQRRHRAVMGELKRLRDENRHVREILAKMGVPVDEKAKAT